MPDGRRQIQFGHATRLENESAKRFETAILYSVYSNDGINGCSVAFQRHLRDRIVRFPSSARPRPVHYNWLSDSHDAVERLAMQHNAAIFLPMAVTGSHVGPRTCHTSGRTSDIRFRAWVAAQRYLGFEMDPRELTPEETRVLGKVIRWWKENRDWMQIADILRLDSSDKAVIAEQQLEQGGGQFVVFAGKVRNIGPDRPAAVAVDETVCGQELPY